LRGRVETADGKKPAERREIEAERSGKAKAASFGPEQRHTRRELRPERAEARVTREIRESELRSRSLAQLRGRSVT
jgi:hypothetical protein